MRLNVPTNEAGEPIISHMAFNSMLTVPVQRGADGRFYIDGVTRFQFVGLLQSKYGTEWDRANPNA